MDGSVQPTWPMNSPQRRQVGQWDWEQFSVPTGGIASAWRPLEGSLRVGKRLLPSRSNFSPSPSSSPSLLSRPPPLFLDAHRRALQPLRALHQSSLSIPLSSRVPFSHRQRHGDPLSMVIEICCHGPSGATARTSPGSSLLAPLTLSLLLRNSCSCWKMLSDLILTARCEALGASCCCFFGRSNAATASPACVYPSVDIV
jgi:hypothetical protein